MERGTNNNFFDREVDDRADRMQKASESGGVTDFFDLSPEERAACYDEE